MSTQSPPAPDGPPPPSNHRDAKANAKAAKAHAKAQRPSYLKKRVMSWTVAMRTGEHTWSTITVDADTPDEAIKKAAKLIGGAFVSVG